MIYELIQHIWKATVRSILWYRNLATNIFFGLILLLLILNLLSFGLFIDRILQEVFPNVDPVRSFNGILFYYFLIDLILRAFLQRTPGLEIRPYLHLPIHRSRIIHFLLLRSTLSFFNFLPLLVFFPFAIKIIQPLYSVQSALAWLAAVYGLVLSVSFLHFYLEKLRITKPRRVFILFLIVAMLMVVERWQLLHLAAIAGNFFQFIVAHPWAFVLSWLLLLIIYQLNGSLLKRPLYFDRLSGYTEPNRLTADAFGFLDRLGDTGRFLSLELKLLFRNKRSKSSFSLVVFTIAIVPLFYLSISDQLDFYPVPEMTPSSIVAIPAASPEDRLITFKVIAGPIPENAHVYITGDHQNLGRWRPSHLPLLRQPDSSWSRAIAFQEGTKLRYIFTLGSWENEARQVDSKKPDVRILEVASDTTIIQAFPTWKTPRRLVLVDIMIIYMGLLFTGILMLIYGQFIFAWESNYFDLLLSRPILLREYLNAKLLLLLLASALALFLVSLPVAFFSFELFWMNSALFVYNIGVNSFAILAWATLSRKRMDLIEATAGEVRSQGKVVKQSEHWKRYTGSYLDERFLIDYLTPEEYFEFVGHLYGLNQTEFDQFLERFRDFFNGEILSQNKYIREFSRGNQKRIGIAAALMSQPAVLILDEPFPHLDPTTVLRLKRILKDFHRQQKATLLISSHDLNHVTEVCERIAILEKGIIIHDLQTEAGTLAQLHRYFEKQIAVERPLLDNN